MKLGRETKIERNFKVMAVITKFVIVRDGVELETVFSTKKEAEAHDKMLDAADEISNLIMHHGADRFSIDGGAIKAIAEYIAENAVTVTKILKGVKPVKAVSKKSDETTAQVQSEKPATAKSKTKSRTN